MPQLLGVVYLGLTGLTFASGIRDVPLVLFGLSLLAVAVGIALAVIMSRMPFFDRRGPPRHPHPADLRRARLPAARRRRAARRDDAAASRLRSLQSLPVVLCAAAILIAFGVHRLLRDVPGVFTLPGRPWPA